jgi:hypothetical protein
VLAAGALRRPPADVGSLPAAAARG